MKITNTKGTYPKRITSLIRLFNTYFGSSESETRDAVEHAAALVRYFKSSNIYFSKCSDKLESNNISQNFGCEIQIDTYIEKDIVCCNDYIILKFPSIEEVIHKEYTKNSNKEEYKEKYLDYLN